MIRLLIRKRKHLRRYRDIVAALSRHGLGWLAVQLGLGNLLPFHRGLLGHARQPAPYTGPEHFRAAMEDLGAVYIKLGQMLSTRTDLLPPAYLTTFARLQDAAPPVAYQAVAAVVREELGSGPEAIFAHFEPEPLASASLGQVHAALLPDGTPVVVKVQRPGVAETVEQDLAVLDDLAHLAAKRTALGAFYDPDSIIDELGLTLRDELDYEREGRNADRFARQLDQAPYARVPRVYWQYSTRRVLTMERIQGIKITDLDALDAAGLDRHAIAENAARIVLESVFAHGFFHADPHPGNFFVLPDNVIGLIDFGMVGRLNERLRARLLRLMFALVRQDSQHMARELADLGVAGGTLDAGALERDLEHFIDAYYDRPLAELAASEAFGEIMGLAYRHHLRLPSDLVLLAKVIAMSESLGARLDPEFRLLAFAAPYVRRFWLASRGPSSILRQVVVGASEIADLGLELPPRARALLRGLERGELTFTVRHEGLHEERAELERLARWLGRSFLFGSGLITLGLIWSARARRPPPAGALRGDRKRVGGPTEGRG